MSVSVDTSQLERLAADLAASGVKAAAASEVVLSATGRDVLTAARMAAPVLTGALRNSIQMQTGRGERVIGSSLEYGFYQEFGTSKMSPHPWLSPAVTGADAKLAAGLLAQADPF